MLVGFWLITNPNATVGLDAVVTLPSVRLTLDKVIAAAVCVLPSTEGTAMAEPEETTSATALPAATCVPPVGFWLMTDPDGTVALGDVVTLPSVRPAFVKSVVAADCVSLTTDGTVTGGPDEITSATAVPVATCAPLAGFWLITDPDVTVVLDAVVTVPSVRPAFVKSFVAADCVSLTTEGTVTSTGPVETTKLTALPTSTCVPPAGF